MGEIVLAAAASEKLRDIREFYRDKSEEAGERAVSALLQSFARLRNNPKVGGPWRGSLIRRELVTPFGAAGFVSLYEVDQVDGRIVILAIRHQRESRYRKTTSDAS